MKPGSTDATVEPSPVRATWLGRMAYAPALQLQRTLFERRKSGQIEDTVLLVEHDHVFTFGRRGIAEHVISAPDVLAAAGAEVHETDRGGETTYHGPGQLVMYPIFSIREAGLGPVTYVRLLEQTVIDTLREFGVSGHRVVGKTGVFVGGEPGERPPDGVNPRGRKIAAIGVRVSGGVAMHGFALNVSTDLSYYSHIVPCGMPGMPTTSIEKEQGARIDVEAVGRIAAEVLAGFLQRPVRWLEADAVAA